jgi:hypothetical protein
MPENRRHPRAILLRWGTGARVIFPLTKLGELALSGDLIFGESNFIVDLHLVEQPIGVALEDLGEMNSDIARRLPETVHDSAQGGLVNAQHSRQTVLPNARGVNPQLQVRVNVSIHGHAFALGFYQVQRSAGDAEEAVLAKLVCNPDAKP